MLNGFKWRWVVASDGKEFYLRTDMDRSWLPRVGELILVQDVDIKPCDCRRCQATGANEIRWVDIININRRGFKPLWEYENKKT